MTEAIVSMAMDQLYSILKEEVKLVINVKKEAEKLESKLATIKAVLKDGEKKQLMDVATRDWLDKLKDASYDIDDMVDEWKTSKAKLQMKKAETFDAKLKVCRLVAFYLLCYYKQQALCLRYNIVRKIRDANERLADIARDSQNFIPNTGSSSKGEDVGRHFMTISSTNEGNIRGRYCHEVTPYILIEKQKLIRLWMAQGYINDEKSPKEMEKVGEDYFEMLAERLFFQDFREDFDDTYYWKMHDIVHDLAQFLTKYECFNIVINSATEPLALEICFEKARHLRIMVRGQSCLPISSIPKMRKLRTLFIIVYTKSDSVLFEEFLSKLISQCTRLRTLIILDLLNSRGFYRLAGIGKHMLLRFLRLSSGDITEFPKAIYELHNLQTLDIEKCDWFDKLPRGTIGFKVTKETKLEYLRNLNQLRGRFGLYSLGNVMDVNDARRMKLKDKKNLTQLALYFDKIKTQGTRDKEKDGVVLDALEPTSSLVQLKIVEYQGKFINPGWLQSLSMS